MGAVVETAVDYLGKKNGGLMFNNYTDPSSEWSLWKGCSDNHCYAVVAVWAMNFNANNIDPCKDYSKHKLIIAVLN